ncbi:MAG TPA: response regulator [Geobacteraceae bacterium]|nr:response regulator [Geobacteraceae bacterium]
MSRKKVVLADDVELFLMLENTFFNREEFELITARSGREVLKVIREAKPDLVFVNLEMPELNGDECCRIVKSDDMFLYIPVIIVTPGGRREDIERCRLAGCNDIVLKPIDRHAFMVTSRKFLQVRERAVQRFAVRLPVNYGVIPGELLEGYSVDLNTDGMFLATEHPFTAETLLYVEFILPLGERVIRCKAKVAWVNSPESRRKLELPAGMGLQFLDLGPDNMDAIQNYLPPPGPLPRGEGEGVL